MHMKIMSEERKGILLRSRNIRHLVATKCSPHRKGVRICAILESTPNHQDHRLHLKPQQAISSPHPLSPTDTQPHNPEIPPDTVPAHSALSLQSAPALHIPPPPQIPKPRAKIQNKKIDIPLKQLDSIQSSTKCPPLTIQSLIPGVFQI